MYDQIIALNRFNLGYLERLMTDITEAELDHEPAPGLHSVRWILAHLAIVSDGGLRQLDLPTRCPKAWQLAYGPSSPAGTNPDVRPSKEELLSAIKSGYTAVTDALPSASPDLLAMEHGIERLKPLGLPTRGMLLCHVLTTHFSFHLGQLSTLRRLQGKPVLF
jgi:uncharacterized damage-inducible protein DinB